MINRLVPLSAVTEPRVVQAKPSGNGEFTYVDISSIDNTAKRVVSAKRVAISRAPSRARQHLRAGDVVVSMTRPNLNAVALIDEALDHTVGTTGFDVLRATQGTLPLWIYYAVQSPQFISAMCGLVQGALYPAVRPKDIRSYRIPLPPLDQQERIVAEIEKQFTRLDAGMASLKRVRSELKAACEGRLVSTEGELAREENRSYETGEELLQRILRERRDKCARKGKYKEPAAPDVGDLPELPNGWVWASAEQITAIITDGEHITPRRSDSGVLLLSARNILNGKLALEDVDYVSESEYERIATRLTVKPGDVLLSCSGTVGRSTIAPEELKFTLVRSVAVLKPLLRMGKYLSLTLRSPILQQQILRKKTQTAQANIFQGKIKTLSVPLPPLAEQQRIVLEVERRLSVVEEVEAVVSVELQRSVRLRQSVLQRAFEGKLANVDSNKAI